jgi:proteasome lid subunit RPN8/RPN11
MSDAFLPVEGLIVPPTSLTLPRARGLAEIAGGGILPFVRLVECRRLGGMAGDGASEVVVFDAVVERPQATVHDIRREERVAAIFHPMDRTYPEALVLRPTFPRVPHINLTGREFPRSLCLYDRPWAEVALRWTPAAFIERIRFWLTQTARGALHQEDQPLEPLLFDSGLRIVLPADLLTNLGAETPVPLELGPASLSENCRTLIAFRPQVRKDRPPPPPQYVVTTFEANPQSHGIIRRSPDDMTQLHDFLTTGGIDLIGSLRRRLRDWYQARPMEARLIIIVALPLTRTRNSSTESWDFWAFLTTNTVREVGTEIGIWDGQGGKTGLLVFPDDKKRGQGVQVQVVSPYLEFSRVSAAVASGICADPCKVVAVGAGALGSQTISGLARSGFGTWTIVDEDDLLPHNLARHALNDFYVGHTKAAGMAHHLDMLYREGDGARFVSADILSPGNAEVVLNDAFSEADLILDIAASVPVARHLASVDSKARRVSVFLNSQGTDVVVLAEDKDRRFSLDALEAQYYRAAAADPRLAGHLAANQGRLRYGRSCRDITASIPNHLVTMHASIACQAVRWVRASDTALIRVWRCDTTTLAITPMEVEPAPPLRRMILGWTLVLDEQLLRKLAELRAAKLPNETGGVLIGVYDLHRRVVYAVETVPSPPDSSEWPTLYIRGSNGLVARVRELSDGSGGQLEYIGEWHSHPDGCPTLPSSDDQQVFTWLTEHLAVAGLPALMAIVGENAASSWYMGQMLPSGGWGVTT